MTAACCLLGVGSMLCAWLGSRLDSVDWFFWAGNILMIQAVALAIGVFASGGGLIGDIIRRRGWKICLKRIACAAVMLLVFFIAEVYHVAMTGGV